MNLGAMTVPASQYVRVFKFATAILAFTLVFFVGFLTGEARAENVIKGQVMGGGAPIANSAVTLWAASADAPKQLAQTKTNAEGKFEINNPSSGNDTSCTSSLRAGCQKPGAETIRQ